MHIFNATRMIAGYTMGLRPDGKELVVVVVKGTFVLDLHRKSPDAEPVLAAEQAPITLADTFEGEPGLSATIYESDFPYVKPKCDVLFHGCAYAPNSKPAPEVEIGLACGPIQKQFIVTGNRSWKNIGIALAPSAAEPFLKQRFSYGTAFGGVDKPTPDPKSHKWFVPNPAGIGYHPASPADQIVGKPAPNTHIIGEPINSPAGNFKPMALGPIGRAWQPRPKFAGTYDKKWQDEVFPFLPADFDERYFQAAPEDQQMPHPTGGEEITLVNLTSTGLTKFRIPTFELPIVISRRAGVEFETHGTIDTIIIEPELSRYSIIWRASMPLTRNMHELRECVIGRMSTAWYRARALGKTYFPSLAALATRRAEEELVELTVGAEDAEEEANDLGEDADGEGAMP